jgi:hypothetical protein
VLPFRLHGNQCAKFGDGRTIKYHYPGCSPEYEDLYQPGNNGGFGSRVRLALVFDNWRKMIEDGRWQVDSNGVMGSIEKFKEADTPESWQLYQIKRTW